MPKTYTHLSLQERAVIHVWLEYDLIPSAIARWIFKMIRTQKKRKGSAHVLGHLGGKHLGDTQTA